MQIQWRIKQPGAHGVRESSARRLSDRFYVIVVGKKITDVLEVGFIP